VWQPEVWAGIIERPSNNGSALLVVNEPLAIMPPYNGNQLKLPGGDIGRHTSMIAAQQLLAQIGCLDKDASLQPPVLTAEVGNGTEQTDFYHTIVTEDHPAATWFASTTPDNRINGLQWMQLTDLSEMFRTNRIHGLRVMTAIGWLLTKQA
jgi:hypothetical protein